MIITSKMNMRRTLEKCVNSSINFLIAPVPTMHV